MAPVTSDAMTPGAYWTPPWRYLIALSLVAEDLSANSSLSVTNVDGKFPLSLQVVNRSCGKELEPLESVNAWLGDKHMDKGK